MIRLKKLLLIGGLFFSILLLACQNKQSANLEVVKIEQGWGYLIRNNEKIFIRQHYIPAIPGQHQFLSKNDAEKTGKLVLKKIKEKKHLSVSVQELDSLGVSYPANVVK